MLVAAPSAFQGAGDGVRPHLAVGIARRCQRAGFTLPVQDRPDHGRASPAGDVADNVGKRQLHQLEGFLHVLDVAGGIGDERGGLAAVRSTQISSSGRKAATSSPKAGIVNQSQLNPRDLV